MKAYINKAIGFLVLFTLICGVAYTATITAAAQLIFPQQANGSIIEIDGTCYGSKLLGQSFTAKDHLWGRPVNLDVSTYKNDKGEPLAYAAPSNLSPASKEYEAIIGQRVEDMIAAHPTKKDVAIPVELVTGSGSGLDPHISIAAAEYQIDRIAQENNISTQQVKEIIDECTTGRFLGVFGEKNVNVLLVNIKLEQMKDL